MPIGQEGHGENIPTPDNVTENIEASQGVQNEAYEARTLQHAENERRAGVEAAANAGTPEDRAAMDEMMREELAEQAVAKERVKKDAEYKALMNDEAVAGLKGELKDMAA